MLGVDGVVFLNDSRVQFDEQLLGDWWRRNRCSIEVGSGHRHGTSGAAAHDETAK